jgi:hypothetical protein
MSIADAVFIGACGNAILFLFMYLIKVWKKP